METMEEIVNKGLGTKEEVIAYNIETYKAQLASTDYQCLKYVEGELTEDEYAPIRELRKQLRKQINELERVNIQN